MANIITSGLARIMKTAEVGSVRRVSESMREVTLTASAFASWKTPPGSSIRLALGRYGIDALRTYSIWNHEGDTFTLRGLHRADGPGSAFMRDVEPGATVMCTSPKTVFGLDADAPWHLFVGDESGAVPLLTMRAALPEDASVLGLLEAESAPHRVPADGRPELPWTDRDEPLAEKVRKLTLPEGPGVAYLAGERDVCLAIRAYLRDELGWGRRAVKVSAHWAPGKKGLE